MRFYTKTKWFVQRIRRLNGVVDRRVAPGSSSTDSGCRAFELISLFIPGLLLKNTSEASELISYAVRHRSLRRLGWLADVAEKISEEVPREYLQPDALRWLHAVQAAATGAKDKLARDEINYVFPPSAQRPAQAKLRERAWALSPPLTKRWGIACDITLRQFLSRALTVLEAR